MPPPKTASRSARRTTTSSSRHRTPSAPVTGAGWRRAVEIGLLSVLLVAPLFMGGRHPLGQFALLLMVGATTLVWLVRQCVRGDARWHSSWAEVLLLFGFLLLLAQLVPWPKEVLAKLSPATFELLPLWTAGNAPWFHFGDWTRLSLSPADTQCGLVLFITYGLLFFLVAQYVRDLRDVQRVLQWLACAAMGMATIGLAQFLVGNGKFLWFYAHPMRNTDNAVKGTFINENHFAHFIAMGLGPLIWWLWDSITKSQTQSTSGAFSSPQLSTTYSAQKVSLFIGLGCVCVAGLMSFSRGGVLTMFFAATVTVGLFTSNSLLGRNSIIGLLGIGGLVGTSLFVFGGERLSQELGSITASNSVSELLDVRLTLWRAMFQVHDKFRWFGTGVGSHAEVYPIFFQDYSPVEFSHGESGYFQLLEETGFLGLGLMLAGILYCFRCCQLAFRNKQDQEFRACIFVVFAGLSTSVLHSCVDFVWYIPACMSLTVVYAALACRLSQMAIASNKTDSPQGIALGPNSWRIVTALVAGMIALMVHNQVGRACASVSWDRYLTISLSHSSAVEPPKDDTSAMLLELEKVLSYEPENARAHLRYASLTMLQFEQRQRETDNAMSAAQIREAAFASKFPSKEAQSRWLQAAFPENYPLLVKAAVHARRSAEFCPVQGEPYLLLGELVFLDSPSSQLKKNYLSQALRLRPYHAGILATAGSDAAMDGDVERAMRFWRFAFRQDPIQRKNLVESFGKQLSAEDLVEQFKPDLAGQRVIYEYYRAQNRKEDAEFVGAKLAASLEEKASHLQRESATEIWRDARNIYLSMSNIDKALECAQNTVAGNSCNLGDRKSLASILLNCDRVEEAIQELQWCRSRQPDDPETTNSLKIALRYRAAMGGTPVSKKSGNSRNE